jgi:uncharacterized protein (TIGR01777 family)
MCTGDRAGASSMNILISGSSGLIGSTLRPLLEREGHRVIPLVRRRPASGERFWDPESGTIDPGVFDDVDAVVHLAGRNIASRWTEREKELIRSSRVEGTRLVSDAITASRQAPRVFVSASGVNYYGDRGDEWLEEESPPGDEFLSEVCVEWERATEPAAEAGSRVVNTRFGVVLSDRGGALAKALPPFRAGLGGVLGDGRQYWSWISLEDVTRTILHALLTESLSGPLNVASPQPVRNREFTKILGDVLSRPTILPVPAFAAHLVLGEMADELLLSSARMKVDKLLDSGFTFIHPELESALRHALQ